MALFQISNNAKTTLFSGITDVATTLTVVSKTGFPTSGDFVITVWDANSYKDPGDDSSMEIMIVTAISGNTFTVTRAQESTTGKAHVSGNAVQMLFTAGILQETRDAIPANINDLDDVDFDSGTLIDTYVLTFDTATGKWKSKPSSGGGGGDNDKVKVSSNDTTAGYLNGKLIAGTGISLTEGNDAGDETLTVARTDGAFEIDVNGGLMPVTTSFSDDYWELDGNSDLQPKTA